MKFKALAALLLLSGCTHEEYNYEGMINNNYVKFEVMYETKPGKFKDLPGRVREKEYVPFYNLMTIITEEQDTVQLYDIDNNLKPDYVVASYKGLGFRIAPIETFDKPRQDFIVSEWCNTLDSIKVRKAELASKHF